MDDIISRLYNAYYLTDCEVNEPNFLNREENEQYDKLMSCLTPSQLEIFENFLGALLDNMEEESFEKFSRGVNVGIKLAKLSDEVK